MSYPPPPPSGSYPPPPYPPPYGGGGGGGYPMMPPIVMPQARGKSLGSALFTALMVTLLGCSLTLNFWLLVLGGVMAVAGSGGGSGGGGSAPTEVVVKGDSTKKVYVVELTGVIEDATYKRFVKLMKQVEEDASAKAVVLHIDTPGGTVTASEDIYQLVNKFKKDKGIPVVIEQGGMATSGGYYISAAGDRIFAGRTTWTGNIGVIMQRFNVSKLMDKYGVDDATLVSTGAIYKDAGSMFKPENAKDRAYLQGLMDDAFATFKKVIVDGRGKALAKPIDEIADGRVYTADQALALGLVDAIGGRDDVLAWLSTAKGLTGAEVVRFEDPSGLLSLFRASSHLGGAGASGGAAKVGSVEIGGPGGVKVELTAEALRAFASPRPMYLWQGN